VEERRKLGLVRFSLAMDDMRRLVDQAGFAEHEDSDVDEEADSARQRATRAQAQVSVLPCEYLLGFTCRSSGKQMSRWFR
jgi:hypothetical protein